MAMPAKEARKEFEKAALQKIEEERKQAEEAAAAATDLGDRSHGRACQPLLGWSLPQGDFSPPRSGFDGQHRSSSPSSPGPGRREHRKSNAELFRELRNRGFTPGNGFEMATIVNATTKADGDVERAVEILKQGAKSPSINPDRYSGDRDDRDRRYAEDPSPYSAPPYPTGEPERPPSPSRPPAGSAAGVGSAVGRGRKGALILIVALLFVLGASAFWAMDDREGSQLLHARKGWAGWLLPDFAQAARESEARRKDRQMLVGLDTWMKALVCLLLLALPLYTVLGSAVSFAMTNGTAPGAIIEPPVSPSNKADESGEVTQLGDTAGEVRVAQYDYVPRESDKAQIPLRRHDFVRVFEDDFADSAPQLMSYSDNSRDRDGDRREEEVQMPRRTHVDGGAATAASSDDWDLPDAEPINVVEEFSSFSDSLWQWTKTSPEEVGDDSWRQCLEEDVDEGETSGSGEDSDESPDSQVDMTRRQSDMEMLKRQHNLSSAGYARSSVTSLQQNQDADSEGKEASPMVDGPPTKVVAHGNSSARQLRQRSVAGRQNSFSFFRCDANQKMS